MATITLANGHQFEAPDLPPPIRPGLALDDPYRAKLIRSAERTKKHAEKRAAKQKRKRQNRLERDQIQRGGE